VIATVADAETDHCSCPFKLRKPKKSWSFSDFQSFE
jgi:hypothetical protein